MLLVIYTWAIENKRLGHKLVQKVIKRAFLYTENTNSTNRTISRIFIKKASILTIPFKQKKVTHYLWTIGFHKEVQRISIQFQAKKLSIGIRNCFEINICFEVVISRCSNNCYSNFYRIHLLRLKRLFRKLFFGTWIITALWLYIFHRMNLDQFQALSNNIKCTISSFLRWHSFLLSHRQSIPIENGQR